jgi:hypothetical protein
MHSAQSVLADNQGNFADEADAHATSAAHRRTAVCAGAQRAAAAAALEAQATLPGSSCSCGQARSTTTRGCSRRSAHELSGTRSRCSFRRRSRRSTPAARSGGTAAYNMGEGTERSTESTVFPTDESMYGARARASLRPAPALQVHRHKRGALRALRAGERFRGCQREPRPHSALSQPLSVQADHCLTDSESAPGGTQSSQWHGTRPATKCAWACRASGERPAARRPVMAQSTTKCRVDASQPPVRVCALECGPARRARE